MSSRAPPAVARAPSARRRAARGSPGWGAPANDALQQAGAGRVAQAQRLALDRAQRASSPNEPDDGPQATTTCSAGSAPGSSGPRRRVPARAGALGGARERGAHQPRIGGVVVGQVAGAAHGGREGRSKRRAALGSSAWTFSPKRSRGRARARGPRPRRDRARASAAARAIADLHAVDLGAARAASPASCARSRRPSSSRARSPASVSATGASMPAATRDVPAPSSPRSSRGTTVRGHGRARPRRGRRCRRRRRLRRSYRCPVLSDVVSSRFAGMTRISS